MRILLASLLFIACNFPKSRFAEQQSNPNAHLTEPDTATTTPFSVTSKPEIFETAFFIGTPAKIDTFSISFFPVDIGKINIESGKLIAWDPMVE